MISALCNGRLGMEHEIFLLTVVKGEAKYKLNRHVKQYGLLSSEEYFGKGKVKTLPGAGQRYLKAVKQIKPDVILCFLPEPCFIAGFFRKKLGIPVIGSERGNPYYQYRTIIYRFLADWLYLRADGFVFQTEGARNYFPEKLQKRSVIIGNPVTEEEDLPYIPAECRKKEFVAVGRFTPEKNYPLLLRAFSKFYRKHPEFKLRIYGRIDNKKQIMGLIYDLGISDCVFLEGQTDSIRKRIYDSYAYILSSFSEGLPNALMEAMSAGMPVIATDCPCGGPGKLITDGENGLLVENNNEQELTGAMDRLAENPALAEQLGKQAKNICVHYSAEKISAQWDNYIRQICKSKAGKQ